MLSPGDPVRQMIAGNEDIVVSQVEIDALRHELGLDKPFIFQYLDWLGRAVQGDFGFSYMVKKPVVEELMQSLPATLILALASTLFMLVFSLPLGIYSAVKRNSVFDYAVRGLYFFWCLNPTKKDRCAHTSLFQIDFHQYCKFVKILEDGNSYEKKYLVGCLVLQGLL